jgi:hypothetical protein
MFYTFFVFCYEIECRTQWTLCPPTSVVGHWEFKIILTKEILIRLHFRDIFLPPKDWTFLTLHIINVAIVSENVGLFFRVQWMIVSIHMIQMTVTRTNLRTTMKSEEEEYVDFSLPFCAWLCLNHCIVKNLYMYFF